MADNGSIRRCDIIVINTCKIKGIIVDLTVGFEMSNAQPKDINDENIQIYNPTIAYYEKKISNSNC